jgi:RND family efflux transporter MFP subunit
MKKKIAILVVVILAVLAIGIRLASNAEVAKTKAYIPDLNKSILVQTKVLSEQTFNQELRYTGTFQPNREIQLMPQAQGAVTAVYISEGSSVKAGQLLVKIDDALLRSQLIAAQASYQNAKLNAERFQNASKSEGVSQLQLDNANLQLKSAESQLKQLEIAISKCAYKAPFSGMITQKSVEVGTVVGMSPIARLTDVSTLKLELKIPETDILRFKNNQKVDVISDLFPGVTFKGQVIYVSDRGDESHNYQVLIRVPNQAKNQLKAGMYGQVTLQQQLSPNSLTIPRAALLGSVKKPQVYVVENNLALLRNITTGKNNGTEIEVLGGLNKGDVIVVGGQINLTDSCKVTISK